MRLANKVVSPPISIKHFFPMPVQVLCVGTIIAASLTYDKLLDIKHNTGLYSTIDDVLMRETKATSAVALTAGVIMVLEGIGMTVVMTLLYLIGNTKVTGILDKLVNILVCAIICVAIIYKHLIVMICIRRLVENNVPGQACLVPMPIPSFSVCAAFLCVDWGEGG